MRIELNLEHTYTVVHGGILLVASIEKEVDNYFSYRDRMSRDYMDWKKSLEKMGKGLKQLDGTHDRDYEELWDDSALVLAHKLSLANAALSLKDNFANFIDETCRVLKVKDIELSIVGIVFDIDKFIEILDFIRKYTINADKLKITVPVNRQEYNLILSLLNSKKPELVFDFKKLAKIN